MPPKLSLLKNPVFTNASAGNLLKDGDCIRMFDGTFHFVQYVNSSGAYAVPLATLKRDIKGATIAFTAGGRTISSHAIVEKVNPLLMGGSSPEYGRYVRMARALGKAKGTVARMGDESGGAGFGSFDTDDIDSADLQAAEIVEAEGQSAGDGTVTPNNKAGKSMAKKAKAATAAKKDKATKTVRKCACGCGGETTGYFVPGHDARFHGWIKKLADGRIDATGKDVKSGEKVIGAAVLKSLTLVKSGDGFKAKTPEYYKEA